MTSYLTGFGNTFATEAEPGALPARQNSPQQTPFGLYAEQLSGTAFTAPRAENRRTWVYRLRPSAMHRPFEAMDRPVPEFSPTPNRLRWNPPPIGSGDFVDGLATYAGAGDPQSAHGLAIHLYAADRSMERRAFASADGELLIVPQQGALRLTTELGVLDVAPGEMALVPRGLKLRAELSDGPIRGYVCENFGAAFRLPELGPIGANGLADPSHFLSPQAAYETGAPHELVHKFAGRFWRSELDHSPFDVVAWRGNLAPAKYDLALFNTMNTVSFDHPDPSIFTVLTSPSDTPGVANVDFVIFPPRWMVAEHTFRPPYFHRNVMSEFMGLVHGAYDAKQGGFAPGGASLHPSMSAHGPDAASYEKAIRAELAPHKLADTLAFMFESRAVLHPTRWALNAPHLQPDYDACWNGFQPAEPTR